MPTVKEKWHRILPFAFLGLFVLSRWPGLFPPSFSVAYALVFCAGVYFPNRVSSSLLFVVMLATDTALNCYYQHKFPNENIWSGANLANLGFNYAAYIVLNFLGWRFKSQASFLALLGGGLLGAILFFVITNTASWLFNPEYAKTIADWIRALTTGVSGWPQTWEFFRNTLLSGGLFTGLFVGAMKLTASAESPAEKEAGNKAADSDGESETTPEEAKA